MSRRNNTHKSLLLIVGPERKREIMDLTDHGPN